MIGRLATLPVHAATSRTCAIDVLARDDGRDLRARQHAREIARHEGDFGIGLGAGRIVRRDRIAAAIVHQQARRIELRHVGGELRGVSDRFEATRTNGRTRTISRSPARMVVEMRITWRAALASPERGSLSVLRAVCATRSAGEGAAQRRLDPFGQGGEVRLAVERDVDRAAHQRGAAEPGEDRAGEPLNGDAAAIDDADGRAVDKQWRFVAEIDRL